MPLAGFSTKPLYEPFDHAQYATVLAGVLSQVWDITPEELYEPPNKVRTWLDDEKGKRCYIDLEEIPWP
jgi:hypothetical protein